MNIGNRKAEKHARKEQWLCSAFICDQQLAKLRGAPPGRQVPSQHFPRAAALG
jgi:hypothetical protein